MFYGVGLLIDLLTIDPTPKRISLAERESSYPEEEEEDITNKVFSPYRNRSV